MGSSDTNGSGGDSDDNESTESVDGVGLGPIDSDASLGKAKTVRFRDDQEARIQTLVDRYGLSQSEAIRLHFDLAGANPDRLQEVEARLRNLEERTDGIEDLDELVDLAEEIEEAVGSINRAYPDTAMEVKEILQLCRNLRKGEDPPDWFEQYI